MSSNVLSPSSLDLFLLFSSRGLAVSAIPSLVVVYFLWKVNPNTVLVVLLSVLHSLSFTPILAVTAEQFLGHLISSLGSET